MDDVGTPGDTERHAGPDGGAGVERLGRRRRRHAAEARAALVVGGAPLAELRIPGGGDGKNWRGFPSQSYVKAAGCYGYQTDGFGFSRVVVVRVET